MIDRDVTKIFATKPDERHIEHKRKHGWAETIAFVNPHCFCIRCRKPGGATCCDGKIGLRFKNEIQERTIEANALKSICKCPIRNTGKGAFNICVDDVNRLIMLTCM
jgi:hypothetical protein